MGKLSNVLNIVFPKRGPTKATGFTNTYNPQLQGTQLPIPGYQDHLTDLAASRTANDSRAMLQLLFQHDPDVSAAVFAYLTVANTEPVIYVRADDGTFDLDGHAAVTELLMSLTTRTDFSKGFQFTTSLKSLCERMRYMVLLRGGIGSELVLNKFIMPQQLNMLDMKTIFWLENLPGVYVPQQRPASTGQLIDLSGVPTVFFSFFRQDPTTIYTQSPFVSAINTIAARQQIINDLYRIMTSTGYPRIDITVVEEILTKSAPANIQQNAQALRDWKNQQLTAIAGSFSGLRVDQPFAHGDAVEIKIINEKSPGMSVDISEVISVLNGQNQAALKTMATIIGRGESGVNTASVEARVFSMNADEINVPVSDILSQLLTYCLRLQGSTSTVEFKFRPAELRSWTELEPMMTLKGARLKEDLSLGLIDDVEYSMEMYGRPPLPGAPVLSGTGFMQQSGTDTIADKTTPNSDPLGRSLAPTGGKAAKSKAVKKGPRNG